MGIASSRWRSGTAEEKAGLNIKFDYSGLPDRYTLDEAVTSIGMGRFQYYLFMVCGYGVMTDVLELYVVSLLLPIVANLWDLNSRLQGIVGASTYLGMLIGGFFWGWVSDRYGRKRVFLITVIISSVSSLLSATATNPWALIAARIFVGFGVGGNGVVDVTMLTEFSPTFRRGHMLMLLHLFSPIAMILSALLGYLLMDEGWQWFVVASALPGFIIIFARSWIPESPRYLAVNGRLEEAKTVLAKMANMNRKPPLPEAKELYVSSKERKKHPITMLFRKKQWKTTIPLWVMWLAVQFGANGMGLWMPTFLTRKGMEHSNVYWAQAILSLGEYPGLAFALYLCETVGRRRTLTLSFILAGIFAAMFAVSVDVTALVTCAFFLHFAMRGIWSTIYTYTSEVYPTTIRARGLGASSSVARIIGVIGPIISGALLDLSLELAVFVLAGSFVVGGLVTLLLKKETMRQDLHDAIDPPDFEKTFGNSTKDSDADEYYHSHPPLSP